VAEKLGAELKTGYWARKLYERLSDRQIDRLFDAARENGIDTALLEADDLSFDWHSAAILRLVAGGAWFQNGKNTEVTLLLPDRRGYRQGLPVINDEKEILSLGEAANRFVLTLPAEDRSACQQEINRFVRWFGSGHPLDGLTAPRWTTMPSGCPSPTRITPRSSTVSGLSDSCPETGLE